MYSESPEESVRVPFNRNKELHVHYGTSDHDTSPCASETVSYCCTPSQAQWAPPGFNRSVSFHLDQQDVDRSQFNLTVLMSSLLAGLVTVLDNTPYGLVLFPSMFQEQYSSVGVSMILVAAAVSQVSMTYTSAFPCACACMVVENLPFLTMMGRDVTTLLTAQGQEDSIIPTLVFLWAVSSFLSGLAMLALGASQAGKFTAYFPRHVLLGYVGGMGVFIFLAGVEITTNRRWGWDLAALSQLIDPQVAPRLVVTFALWALIPLIKRVSDSPVVMPVYLLSIPVLFWVAVLLMGVSPATARQNEWLIAAGATPGTEGLFPLSMINPTKVAWHMLHTQAFSILAIVIFTVLHIPVNAPALALTLGMPTQINQEFYSHGVSNLLSGAMGGLQTYLVYSTSALYHKCGGGGYYGGMIIAAVVMAFAVGGNVALGLLPRPLAGVVLVHLGSELMYEVFVDSLSSITFGEYLQVVVVVVSMEAFGFMEGLVIGLVLACCAFIVAAAAADPIDVSVSAGGLRSKILRPLQVRKRLDVMQEEYVWMLGLGSDSLFFGNSVRVLEHAERVLDSHLHLRYIVMHFMKLKGADCTAVQALADLVSLSMRRRVAVVFAGLPQAVFERVERALSGPDGSMHRSEDINDAFSWVEDSLLDSVRSPTPIIRGTSLMSLLKPLAPEASDRALSVLSDCFTQQVVPSGTVIWKRGDNPTRAVILSEGLLHVLNGEDTTIEHTVPGNLAGELGLLTGEARQHTLVSREPSSLWVISREKLSAEALSCFQQMVITCASHRLHQLTLMGHAHSV